MPSLSSSQHHRHPPSRTTGATATRIAPATSARRPAACCLLLMGFVSVMILGAPRAMPPRAVVRAFSTTSSSARVSRRRNSHPILPTRRTESTATAPAGGYATRFGATNDDDADSSNRKPDDEDDGVDQAAALVDDVVESILSGASGRRSSAASASASAVMPSSSSSAAEEDPRINTAFQTLFRSTLQRAYSTTAARSGIDVPPASTTVDPDPGTAKTTTAAGVASKVAVDAILDATIVETSNDDNNNNSSNDQQSSDPGSGGGGNGSIAEAVDAMLDATVVQTRERVYSKRAETKKQRQTWEHHPSSTAPRGGGGGGGRYEFPFATSYKSHPALNNVALAHALWSSVVRPNTDAVIDATCGNGNDSIVLAEILFGGDGEGDDGGCGGELLCVDIQAVACERTGKALREVLPPSIRVIDDKDNDNESNDNDGSHHRTVRVLRASHERLPRPTDPSSEVGLVVYNLGWLPGSTSGGGGVGKECVTQTETTLTSLVDATSLLRVGGMLSVVTYPQTGPSEHRAVELFVTCLGLLSSRTRTWTEELESFAAAAEGNDDDDAGAIAGAVRAAMETVVAPAPAAAGAGGNQTWRVSRHDKLGMDRPPVLFTATRIK